ncbi:MAG: hypothetical protein ACEPOW_10175 [Bacteroidales bacterium]
MKKQKLNLSFVKETISKLEMNAVKGGGMSDLSDCIKTGCCNTKTCPTVQNVKTCVTAEPYPCETKSCWTYPTFDTNCNITIKTIK